MKLLNNLDEYNTKMKANTFFVGIYMFYFRIHSMNETNDEMYIDIIYIDIDVYRYVTYQKMPRFLEYSQLVKIYNLFDFNMEIKDNKPYSF